VPRAASGHANSRGKRAPEQGDAEQAAANHCGEGVLVRLNRTSLFWSATLPTLASVSADPTTLRRALRFEVSIDSSGSALGSRALRT
jgi:hypothetical protein